MIEELIIKSSEKELINMFFDNPDKIKKGDYLKYVNSLGNNHRDTVKYIGSVGKKKMFLENSGDILVNDSFDSFRKVTLKDILHYKRQIGIDNILPKNLEESFRYIEFILKRIYPEDRFEISIKNDAVEVIVYYPEIKITNSLGSTHTILDTFIKYRFRRKGSRHIQLLDNPTILRSTFHEKEINPSGFYLFSHTSSTEKINQYKSGFCFGSTELSTTLYKYYEQMSYFDIYNLMYSMDNYLSWESIEGAPYKYIDNLDANLFTPVRVTRHLSDSTEKDIIKCIKSFTFNYDSDSHEGFYIDIHTESIEEYIENYIRDTFPDDLDAYIFPWYKGGAVRRLYPETYDFVKQYENSVITKFKGEEFKFKIVPDTKNIEDLPKKVHPNIIEKIKDILQNKFEEFIIRKRYE